MENFFFHAIQSTIESRLKSREKVSTIRTVCRCRHSFSDQKCEALYVLDMISWFSPALTPTPPPSSTLFLANASLRNCVFMYSTVLGLNIGQTKDDNRAFRSKYVWSLLKRLQCSLRLEWHLWRWVWCSRLPEKGRTGQVLSHWQRVILYNYPHNLVIKKNILVDPSIHIIHTLCVVRTIYWSVKTISWSVWSSWWSVWSSWWSVWTLWCAFEPFSVVWILGCQYEPSRVRMDPVVPSWTLQCRYRPWGVKPFSQYESWVSVCQFKASGVSINLLTTVWTLRCQYEHLDIRVNPIHIVVSLWTLRCWYEPFNANMNIPVSVWTLKWTPIRGSERTIFVNHLLGRKKQKPKRKKGGQAWSPYSAWPIKQKQNDCGSSVA